MKAFKIILPVLICILMISCGYRTCLKSEVHLSKITVEKSNIKYTPKRCEDYPVERREIMKRQLFQEGEDFFRKRGEKVKIKWEDYNLLRCYNEKNVLLWEMNYDEIYNHHLIPQGMVIYNFEKESEVVMLFNEYKSYGMGTPYVIFIDENGRLKKQLTLSQYQFRYMRGYDTTGLGILFLNKYYLIISGGKGFAIFDFDGNDIKWQKLRAHPVNHAALNIKSNGVQYYIIAIDYPVLSTRSSALFIYNQKWELLYEETLGQIAWIGAEKSLTGQDLIIRADDIEDCELTGAPDKYLRYSIR